MKKNTRKITSFVLGITTVSSIALALHFYSFKADFQEVTLAQEKLNEEYKTVLLENEELRQTNQDLHQNQIVIADEAAKLSGLLEQSEMEIERLNKEKENLQSNVATLKRKIAELEKKLTSTP